LDGAAPSPLLRLIGMMALGLSLGLTQAGTVAAQAVGSTAGQFSVDSGAATYAIPISVPPGSGSMAPQLALAYSSQGGAGPFGPGWQLSGLSAISRCPATLANDGFIDGVDFDDNDRLCLDGQRLVAISGAYGAAGTEYRKEIDDFTRIRGYDAMNHPNARFLVETKSGLTYHYGWSGTTSQIKAPGLGTAAGLRAEVLGWAVYRITDKAGNYIAFNYSQDPASKEHLLTKISYTGNAAANLAPYHTVELVYEARPAGTERYLWLNGGQVKQTQRVKSIVVKAEGTQMRVYRLGYQVAGTAMVSRLTQVTECVGTTCLNPTTFEWPAEQVGFAAAVATGIVPNDPDKSDDYPLDLDGDGRTDLLTAGSSKFGVRLMQANGSFAALQATPINRWDNTQKTDFIDYNGDGLLDAITRKTDDENAGYNLHVNTGNSFGTQNYPIQLGSTLERQTFADLTGDGIGDVLWVANNEQGPVYVQAGTGTGYTAAQVTEGTVLKNHQRHVADFTGDGLPDVMACSSDAAGAYYALYVNTGAGFSVRRDANGQPAATSVQCGHDGYPRDMLGDFNGDGLPDIIGYETWWSDLFVIGLSTGNPEDPFQIMTAKGVKAGFERGHPVNNAVLILDVNGDGLADILSEGVNPQTGDGDPNFKGYALYLNTGEFQKDPTTLPDGWTRPDQIVFSSWPIDSGVRTHGKHYSNKQGDFNGDGATDLLIYDVPTKGQYNIVYGRPPAMRITRITNGLGAQVEIDYKPLTDASIYAKASGATYPVQEVQGAIPVVSEFRQSNGLGGFQRTSYFYSGLRSDAKRGSLGFASIRTTDLGTGLTTTTSYRQVFPLTGTVASVATRTGSGKLVSTTANTYVAGQLGSGSALRHVPLLTKVVARVYEPADAGTNPVVSTVTENSYDSWGNLTVATESTYPGIEGNTTPYVTKTTSTYAAPDTTNWILARLLSTRADKNLPGKAATTRTSAFEYDAKGMLKAEVIEPQNAALSLRTEYVRDVFGNITQTKVGAGTPEVRTSLVTYDAKGRYPVSATNALGHGVRTDYDARWGKPTRVEDANHSASTPMVSTATYDAFGREASKTDVLGQTGSVVRQWCTASLCPSAIYGSRAKLRVETRSPDGGRSAIVLDALEREIGKETLMFDGRWSRRLTGYDENGRVAASSEPFFDGETVHLTVHDYDELGRAIAESSDAHQGETSGSRVTRMQYGPLWVKQTDPRGKVRVEYKNALGQVIRVVDPDNKESAFDYDAQGNLIATSDALGNLSTLEYDARGLKLRSVDPDMGAWTFAYTRFGELASQTDAKGQVVHNTYDVLGRLVQRVDDERTTTWTYDTRWKGALTSLSSTDGYAESVSYTAKGQVATRTQKIANVNYTYAYAYDALGRVETLTYPSQFRVKQNFTSYGHLSSIVDANSGLAYVTIQSGDARGNVTGFVYGNGVSTLRTFDAAQGVPRGVSASKGSSVLHQMAFGWDIIGNLAERQDLRRGLAEAFTYDNLNRLKTAQVRVNGTVTGTDSFSYDALGNILSKTGVGTYTYGAGSAGPHAVTSISGARPGTFTYDANGNMLSGWGRTIAWSAANLPTQITQGSDTVRFTYAPGGQRILQVESGLVPRTVVYAGTMYEKQTAGAAVTHRHFVQAGGETIAIVNTGASTATQYLHRDHQKSITLLTNQAGAALEYLSYDAFGKRRNAMTWAADTTDALLQTNSHQTDRGYTGHEQLDRVALIHMNGRVYDAALGRFISPDPFVQFPLSTQGLNRYTYVDNNPLSYTDPSGFFVKKLVKAVVGFLKSMTSPEQILTRLVVAVACGNPASAPACAAYLTGISATIQASSAGARPSDILKAGLMTAASTYLGATRPSPAEYPQDPLRRGSCIDVIAGDFVSSGCSAGRPSGALNLAQDSVKGNVEEGVTAQDLAIAAVTECNADPTCTAAANYTRIEQVKTAWGSWVGVFQNNDTGKTALVPSATRWYHPGDWLTNIGAAAGFRPMQYENAMDVARRYPGALVAGHSKGGGMAQAMARITGGEFTIFNSAAPNNFYYHGADGIGALRNVAGSEQMGRLFYSGSDVLRPINKVTTFLGLTQMPTNQTRIPGGGFHGMGALRRRIEDISWEGK